MHEISGTIVHRWYVTVFGLAFAYFAVRHLGWRRTLVYGVLAFGVGALAENGSVHVGFPYTSYSFDPALRGKELWIGDVPLFVPLSYTFMGYFAFASGRLLARGPGGREPARGGWSSCWPGCSPCGACGSSSPSAAWATSTTSVVSSATAAPGSGSGSRSAASSALVSPRSCCSRSCSGWAATRPTAPCREASSA